MELRCKFKAHLLVEECRYFWDRKSVKVLAEMRGRDEKMPNSVPSGILYLSNFQNLMLRC